MGTDDQQMMFMQVLRWVRKQAKFVPTFLRIAVVHAQAKLVVLLPLRYITSSASPPVMNILHTLLQQTTQTHGGDPIRGNPRYLLKKIFGYLDFTTLRYICAVNRVCRDVGCDPFLWALFNQWSDMPADDNRLARALTQAKFSHLSTLKLDKPETDVNVILEKLFPPDSTLIQSLRSLDLAYSAATTLNKISDNGLGQIENLTELNSLNISHLYEVTDSGIGRLSRLRNLQYLNMGHCPRVSDAGLITLSNFVDLQYLNLEWCIKVGSSGLPFLSRMTKLQSLNVTMCMHINDQCLQTISLISSIQYLNLSDCHNITLQGVNSISRLPRLQFINLSRCPLNDNFLPLLVKIPHLQVLKIAGCKNLTKDAVHSILGSKVSSLIYY